MCYSWSHTLRQAAEAVTRRRTQFRPQLDEKRATRTSAAAQLRFGRVAGEPGADSALAVRRRMARNMPDDLRLSVAPRKAVSTSLAPPILPLKRAFFACAEHISGANLVRLCALFGRENTKWSPQPLLGSDFTQRRKHIACMKISLYIGKMASQFLVFDLFLVEKYPFLHPKLYFTPSQMTNYRGPDRYVSWPFGVQTSA